MSKSLVATGPSPMLGQDSADSRDLALQEALRAAVEQALGRLLPAERIVRFYPLLLERILSEPMGYVQDYQIVHEEAKSGLYRVTVQTTLYSEGLERDLRRLGLFLAASERPRVVLLIAERSDPQDFWQWWWQTITEPAQELDFSRAATELLSARGLVTLDPSSVRELLPEDPIYQQPLLDNPQGVALARALGAQVGVVGQVIYQPPDEQGQGLASGTLRALRTDSGALLARVSASVRVQPSTEQPLIDQAYAALAERLGPRLIDGILAPFTVASLPPREITVSVLSMSNYSDLIKIKQFLQDIPGVREMRQIQLLSGQGSFSVVLTGDPNVLRKAFADRDFGAFYTSVESISEDLLILRVISKR